MKWSVCVQNKVGDMPKGAWRKVSLNGQTATAPDTVSAVGDGARVELKGV